MSIRAFIALALASAPLVAQPPRQAAPTNRDRFADPIPAAEYPAYVRRDAATDPTILRIRDEGMNRSQAMTLAVETQRRPDSDSASDVMIGDRSPSPA